jgi:hypothetical protein
MWGQLIQLAFASAIISFIIADAHIFLWWREYLKSRNALFHKLFSCGLCTGCHISLAFALIFFYHLPIKWIIVYWLDIAFLSALFWIVLVFLLDKSGK